MTSNFFRIGLALKFILLTTLLIIITSLTLGFFFLRSKEKDYVEHLKDKGIALARNLANNSEYALLADDSKAMDVLLESLIREPDVSYCLVHDSSGTILGGIYQERNLDIPAVIVHNALKLNIAQEGLVQEFIDTHQNQLFIDIATPVVTHRLVKKSEQTLVFPGYLGIIEQIKRHLRLEGNVVKEKIGTVRVGLNLYNLTSSITKMKRTLSILTLLVAFLGVLITIILVQLIIRPIRRLVYGTRLIARGDLNYVVKVNSRDEIGELANSFNKMTQFLKKSGSQLEEYSKNLEKMVAERTEKLKATEMELIRAEKFSAIGELVTGITHELNNKLTPILGYIQIFKTMQIDPQISKYLDIIEESALNAKKIVESLLKFSRTAPPEKQYIDLNVTLNETIALVEPHRKKANVEFKLLLDPRLPKTMADHALIGQTFLNILNNALQALEESGGQISIQSQRVLDKILFTIADTGPGIVEEHLAKIFDPFFTTKEVGKGTGLGLSMCYGIIQKHEGTIHVKSTPHKGATFIIELPIKTPRDTKIKNTLHQSSDSHQKGARILVIEDESNIQELLKDILEPLHRVTLCHDGLVAMKQIKSEHFDVYLIDIRMPDMDGMQIYNWMQKNCPRETTKIIFITGDTYDIKTNLFLTQVERPRITKPFQVDILKKLVTQVLEENQ
ncbi:MAG: ATP-binding protein [Chlamydiota bacterium]|nr:ATP-binding protein [Chlamydiota bacterium]